MSTWNVKLLDAHGKNLSARYVLVRDEIMAISGETKIYSSPPELHGHGNTRRRKGNMNG